MRSHNISSCGCVHHVTGNKHSSWKGHGEISGHVWSRIIDKARERRKYFDITIEYAWNLYLQQERRCALTGMPLCFSPSGHSGTASLDRIDSDKGYVEGNVQWVLKEINMAKQSYSQDYFIHICHLVAKHNKDNLAENYLRETKSKNETITDSVDYLQ